MKKIIANYHVRSLLLASAVTAVWTRGMLAGGMEWHGKEPLAAVVFLLVFGWRWLDRYLATNISNQNPD